MTLKSFIFDHLKNIPGWKTNRKLIVFAVDDYGNVRVDSKSAREKMTTAGLKVFSHFDAFDTLETISDLNFLFEALSSVKDFKNNHAVFSPFALPCNIDFELMKENNYDHYRYELLPITYEKLSAYQPDCYSGVWNLWKEGLKLGLLVPQFHGREHLNLKIFEEKLLEKDKELMIALQNRSFTSISNLKYPTISTTAAFDFFQIEETKNFEEIIDSGVKAFKEVFGYSPIQFNAPGAAASSILEKHLVKHGIKFSDNPFLQKLHLGNGNYSFKFNYTGKSLYNGLTNINRNVVFEPSIEKNIDWVSYTLNQIEIAFRLHKPAIISSHRVNFCGHINEYNRKNGIAALKSLLKKIINKWPDAEFISSSELCNMIETSKLRN